MGHVIICKYASVLGLNVLLGLELGFMLRSTGSVYIQVCQYSVDGRGVM